MVGVSFQEFLFTGSSKVTSCGFWQERVRLLDLLGGGFNSTPGTYLNGTLGFAYKFGISKISFLLRGSFEDPPKLPFRTSTKITSRGYFLSFCRPLRGRWVSKRNRNLAEFRSNGNRQRLSPEFRATRLWRREEKGPFLEVFCSFSCVSGQKGPRQKLCAKPWLPVIRA